MCNDIILLESDIIVIDIIDDWYIVIDIIVPIINDDGNYDYCYYLTDDDGNWYWLFWYCEIIDDIVLVLMMIMTILLLLLFIMCLMKLKRKWNIIEDYYSLVLKYCIIDDDCIVIIEDHDIHC